MTKPPRSRQRVPDPGYNRLRIRFKHKKEWNETQHDATTIKIPSRIATNSVFIIESTQTSLLNWWRTFSSKSLNTPLMPSRPKPPRNESSTLTLIRPSARGSNSYVIFSSWKMWGFSLIQDNGSYPPLTEHVRPTRS